jgi:hypothetical protein
MTKAVQAAIAAAKKILPGHATPDGVCPGNPNYKDPKLHAE